MVNTGFEVLTVAGSAVSLTDSLVQKSNYALLGPLETAQVRWRDDGTAPSASVGVLMDVGVVIEYDGDLSQIKFIRASATSGSLPVSYYRRG